MAKQSTLLRSDEISFVTKNDFHNLQILHDMCLCRLLGGCSSMSHCIERLLSDISSWEDEAGKNSKMSRGCW